MTDKLIINARKQLHWHQRLLTDSATAGLWAVWLLLLRPLAGALHWLHGWGMAMRPLALNLLMVGHNGLDAMIALSSTSGVLMLWSRLPSRAPQLVRPACPVRLASEHAGVDQSLVRAGQQSNICIVHHDEHGRIVHIETRSQPVKPSALSQAA